MNVKMDGADVRDVATGKELAGVYQELVRKAIADGRSVVGIERDGALLKQEEITAMMSAEALTGGVLSLKSVDTRELVCATLVEVVKHFEPLRNGMRLVCDALADNSRDRALEAFRPTLGIWLGICEAVEKAVILVQQDAAADAARMEKAQQKLVANLREVQSAFEQEDWVKLSDLVEYELLSAVDEWHSLVKSLLDGLQSGR